mmetsp:Transcript_6601/g.9642  ORF Transcript_6601/g.9642 Transcript_6601/m.9642 type:complete len:255 (+) Transcript_6601:155-919(+)|eukprot:CAMPEP_0195524058 /NCGR_PEP_ID=MMETSP0794_2-20130614/23695_1 /TAXON_ID=515487 /ORGANISM="Stephanopyxis turris, Strain CCMP 815" /LENGTH=254 /DNA_ID=CAMNT_0040654201 /DNA_START=150 /DNA_END=914 /DNA_ORIENTATION=+
MSSPSTLGGRPRSNVCDFVAGVFVEESGKYKYTCKAEGCGYSKTTAQWTASAWTAHLLRCEHTAKEIKVSIAKSSLTKAAKEYMAKHEGIVEDKGNLNGSYERKPKKLRAIPEKRLTLMAPTFEVASYNQSEKPHVANVLFIECGFGNDSHGQNSTKAAVRACRNAVEFNSIPSISRLVPGGYLNLKISVILAVPQKYQDGLDLDEVSKVFAYGNVKFLIQDGGMIAPSGIAIDRLGDTCEDMVTVCASVSVGY